MKDETKDIEEIDGQDDVVNQNELEVLEVRYVVNLDTLKRTLH